jgi:hypothetical protein
MLEPDKRRAGAMPAVLDDVQFRPTTNTANVGFAAGSDAARLNSETDSAQALRMLEILVIDCPHKRERALPEGEREKLEESASRARQTPRQSMSSIQQRWRPPTSPASAARPILATPNPLRAQP